MVCLPDFVGKNVRQNIGTGIQSLTDRTGKNQLGNSCGKRIDRNDAACEFTFALLFHDGGGHRFSEKVSFRFAVKNIGFSLVKLIFQPGLIEKGDIQHAGFIHGPNFYQIHAFADMRNGRGRGNHCGYAGTFTRNQLCDALCLPAVIIFAGEPGNQIPQS